jgi:hypothetical protein
MPEDRAIEVDTVSDYLSSLNLIAGPSASPLKILAISRTHKESRLKQQAPRNSW